MPSVRELPISIEAHLPTADEAIALTGSGFGHALTDPETAVLKDILAHAHQAYTAYDNASGQAVGYGVFETYPTVRYGDLLFASSLMASRQYPGGVGRAILRTAIASGNFSFLGFNTSNPAMYAAGASQTTELYPQLDGSPIPPDIADLGGAFCHRGVYPVHRGLYGTGPLYTTRPEHPLAKQFYGYPGYNYANGDAFLCLGRIAART